MNKKKNILFLAPRLPAPADTGGKIRTLNIIKQLAKQHNIHLVCFSFSDHDERDVDVFKSMGITVDLIPMRTIGLFGKIFRVLFDSVPVTIAKYYSPKMVSVLKSIKKTNTFDAVHIDHLHMAHYRRYFQELPCFLDSHNVEHRIWERSSKIERSPLKSFIFAQQAKKMRAYEAKCVKKFTRTFAVSSEDKNLLEKLTDHQAEIDLIPNGVDTDFFKSGAGPVKRHALAFTGSMDWLPNDDAVIYFCKEILPLIWKKKKDVDFYVVGKSPSAAVKALADRDERIIVTGRVDDVRHYVSSAEVFVVPIRVGGGTRLKILEAMSMEKVVVSTTVGAEGIQYTDGKDILIADEPQEFAHQILTALDQKERAMQIGQTARKLVCGHYDWHILGNKLTGIYQEIHFKSIKRENIRKNRRWGMIPEIKSYSPSATSRVGDMIPQTQPA